MTATATAPASLVNVGMLSSRQLDALIATLPYDPRVTLKRGELMITVTIKVDGRDDRLLSAARINKTMWHLRARAGLVNKA